jgi:hypothetical protein
MPRICDPMRRNRALNHLVHRTGLTQERDMISKRNDAGEIGHPEATNKLVKTAEANRVHRATHVINEWDEDMGSKTSPTGRREGAPRKLLPVVPRARKSQSVSCPPVVRFSAPY